MEIQDLITQLEPLIPDPHRGLPEDVFLFLSRITPLINVDLLIQDNVHRTLLTWRDDGLSRSGWHVPGGIIRFKETAAERIQAVARGELGIEIEFDPVALATHEIIHPSRKVRGHFIPFGLKLIPDGGKVSGHFSPFGFKLIFDGGEVRGHFSPFVFKGADAFFQFGFLRSQSAVPRLSLG